MSSSKVTTKPRPITKSALLKLTHVREMTFTLMSGLYDIQQAMKDKQLEKADQIRHTLYKKVIMEFVYNIHHYNKEEIQEICQILMYISEEVAWTTRKS